MIRLAEMTDTYLVIGVSTVERRHFPTISPFKVAVTITPSGDDWTATSVTIHGVLTTNNGSTTRDQKHAHYWSGPEIKDCPEFAREAVMTSLARVRSQAS